MYHKSTPIDVMMLGWELPPYNTGGLGVACYGLAKGLSHSGVNVAFGLPRQLPQNIPFMKLIDHDLKNVEVTAINSLLQAYLTKHQYQVKRVSNRNYIEYGPSIYQESMHFADIARDWSQQTPHHLIHAHDWMSFPAGMKASKSSGKPWIAHVHATEYDRTGGHVDSQISQLEYQGLKDSDHVITVSDYTKNTVNKYYGISKDKITVVHNGIDLKSFEPISIRNLFPNDHIVLYVGRLTFQKGVEYFLQSAKQVLKYHPNTIFMVVGDGDMYQRHIIEAATMGIGSRVVFTGFLSGNKLRSAYQMADVFVMPSVSEPYGLVALEAIASGVPTIISKQSGVSESINNIYKTDFWDIDKMAGLINSVLSYPHQAQELTLMAQNESTKLSWENAALKTIHVYNQLVS